MTSAPASSTSTKVPPRLLDTLAAAENALIRADAKATSLLQLVVIASAIPSVLGATADLPGVSAPLTWASAAQVLLSLLLLLAVISPRLNRRPTRGSWLYAAKVGPSRLLEAYANETNGHGPLPTALETCHLARRAVYSYHLVQLSCGLLASAAVTLATALALLAAH